MNRGTGIHLVARTDLPDHALDERILRMALELRRLIRDRANDHKSNALRGRPAHNRKRKGDPYAEAIFGAR